MKTNGLVLFCVVALVTAMCLQVLPWWSTVLIGLVAGFTARQRTLTVFVLVFFAAFVAWGLTAYLQDQQYVHPVADLLADMGLGANAYAYLLTAVVGGLAGGLAAALSASLRSASKPRE